MGSAIEAAGIDVHHELWGSAALLTAEGRAINDRLHADYRAAGAELLIANTHNLSRAHCAAYLARHPIAPDADMLLERLTRAAIDSARKTDGLVAGCLASPDRPYARRASLTPEAVTIALRAQYEALLRCAPDVVLFEMLTTESDVEGVAALIDDRVPVGVGLVCDRGAMRSGLPIREAVRAFAAHDVTFFVQCTPYEEVDAALASLLAVTDRAGVYANDGRSFVDGHWHGDGADPETYADAALRWVEAGARLVGGCCGTTPRHIAAIRARLSRR